MSYRKMLKVAIDEKNKDLAKTCIRLAMWDDEPIHQWPELHFGAMLLLAMPEPKTEKRGRKKSDDAIHKKEFYSYACMIKSIVEGKSYSATWEDYARHVPRQNIPDESIGLIAYFLKCWGEADSSRAHIVAEALDRFKIDPAIIDRLAEE